MRVGDCNAVAERLTKLVRILSIALSWQSASISSVNGFLAFSGIGRAETRCGSIRRGSDSRREVVNRKSHGARASFAKNRMFGMKTVSVNSSQPSSQEVACQRYTCVERKSVGSRKFTTRESPGTIVSSSPGGNPNGVTHWRRRCGSCVLVHGTAAAPAR